MKTLLLICMVFTACASNPYERASEKDASRFKTVRIPLPQATRFKLSQGPFGKNSHNSPGNEYHWDFDVPVGTEVLAADSGQVIEVYEPSGPAGGCDPRFSDFVHNIKIAHEDGTVAQYSHIRSLVRVGEKVLKGEIIARTAINGFICEPQLCFGIFRSRKHLYGRGQTETLPLRFEEIQPDGILKQGMSR